MTGKNTPTARQARRLSTGLPLTLTVLSLWASPALAEGPGADSEKAPPAAGATAPEQPDTLEQPSTEAPAASPSEETTAKPTPESGERPDQESATTRAAAKRADAIERAKHARSSKLSRLAERLDALAQQWERVVKAVQAAADLEAQADELEKKTLELSAQAERGLSLVEQTEARRARALARLEMLGLEVPIVGPDAKASEPSRSPEKGAK